MYTTADGPWSVRSRYPTATWQFKKDEMGGNAAGAVGPGEYEAHVHNTTQQIVAKQVRAGPAVLSLSLSLSLSLRSLARSPSPPPLSLSLSLCVWCILL